VARKAIFNGLTAKIKLKSAPGLQLADTFDGQRYESTLVESYEQKTENDQTYG